MNANLTPELVRYAKEIVAERNIPEAEFTKAVMGEVLKEAMRRMDAATTRFLGSEEAMSAMAEAVWAGVPMV